MPSSGSSRLADRVQPARLQARPPRRLLAAGGWTAAAAAGFGGYLRLAQTRAVNSDGAAQALQAWDMLHGNLLLRGWTTSDVSFYTTELPQYALVELVTGLRADVVDIAAAMTYTLVVLLAALLAQGTATGRPGLARAAAAAAIMLAPQLGSGTNVLLSSPDHIGTSVPLLLTWLILDRARPRWHVPVLTSLLLCWAQVADSIVLVAGIIPLAAVCALRLARSAPGAGEALPDGAGPWPAVPGRRWYAALGGGAAAAAVAAAVALRVIRAAGGFTVRPLGTALAPVPQIVGHNLPVAAQCLLLLPGADVFGAAGAASVCSAVLHLAGAALAAAGIALAARRLRRLDLVSQVLLAAVAVNVAVFVLTNRVYAVSSAREIAPVLPFAAALAGRLLGGPLLAAGQRPGRAQPRVPRPGHRRARRGPGAALIRRALLPALCVVAAGYLAGLSAELTTPAAAPQAAQLTAWLEQHRLGTGLSGYWAASVVTLTSGGRVAVRPVAVAGGQLAPNPGEVQARWFSPARSAAHYVVLSPGLPGYPGFTDRHAVQAAFGRPARVYRVGAYTIWYWPRNLLARLARPG